MPFDHFEDELPRQEIHPLVAAFGYLALALLLNLLWLVGIRSLFFDLVAFYAVGMMLIRIAQFFVKKFFAESEK